MKLSSLTAISSVDGRYGSKTEALRPICSEYGLIHRRTIVEVRWFQALCAHPGIPELPALSAASGAYLDELLANFDEESASRVKEIESVTNHDVKAVEYFLKEKFSRVPELAAHSEFLHFACTSEDINNLAYALMMKDAHRDVMSLNMAKVDAALAALAAANRRPPDAVQDPRPDRLAHHPGQGNRQRIAPPAPPDRDHAPPGMPGQNQRRGG